LAPEVSWLKCESCNHFFTEGYFDANVRARHFAKTTTQECVGFDMENSRLAASRVVERITRHIAPEGRWLDVNFGNASLLFAAAEWGFEPHGLEWRQDNAATLRALGIESYFGTLEGFERGGGFSVVTIRDWLDRQPYPQESLRAARRVLNKNGILYLSMPNIGSMVWSFLHANQANPYWSEIELVHLFSRERLYALLEEHGFKPLSFNIDDQGRARMEVIAIAIDL
jgi:SAM-dependent methyltransferase